MCQVVETIDSKIEQNESNQVALKDIQIIYFDGSCKSGSAGSCCYFPDEKKIIMSKPPGKQTNNRGEIYALWLALTHSDPHKHVIIYGDSLWAMNITTKKWKAKENLDLVRLAQTYMENCTTNSINTETSTKRGDFITMKWVKAHSGIEGNEICDRYAEVAANTCQENEIVQQILQ